MWLNNLKKIFGNWKQTSDESRVDSQWCLIGNVVNTHPYGEGGKEIKNGTMHFPPGTKVYCFPLLWGDGYERVMVIGRHRGSHKFVTMIIKTEWITNWRAKVVYNPEVLRRLHEATIRHGETKVKSWSSKEEIDKYLKYLYVRDLDGRAE